MGGPEGNLGKGWGVLGRPWSLSIASWERLRRFRRHLEANLKRLGGFRKPFESAKGSPGLILRASRGVFAWFFGVPSRSQAKIENS